MRGEVFTPMKLVNEMLDTLPEDVWTNPDLKWLDPAAGMGNFPIAIYMRLMECLKILIPDEEMRRKHILEKMLYMVELDESNVFMMKKILCGNNYKLNIFRGSFIEGNYVNIYNIKRTFDIIIGNPPYNGNGSTGNILWDSFIRTAFNYLKNNKYLLFVTPPLWRKPHGEKSKTNDLYKLMVLDNTLIYLEMHDMKDGIKIFKAGTRYDFYLIKKEKPNNFITIIKDTHNIENKMCLNKTTFIPNNNLKFIYKLLAKKGDEKVILLYNRENDKSKKHIREIKDNIYKYPIIYTTPLKEKVKYIYSSKKDEKSFFGISKVIIGETGYENSIIDYTGKYGTSQLSLGIKIDNETHGKLLSIALDSFEFKNILFDTLLYSQFRLNRNIFNYLKKDFYKLFI